MDQPASTYRYKFHNSIGTNWGCLVSAGVAICICISIWFPEFYLWYVQPVNPIVNLTTESKHTAPTDVLEEIGKMDLSLGIGLESMKASDIIIRADKILKGTLSIPGLDDQTISPVFLPRDLELGTPRWQLIFSSLSVVDVLLSAYSISNNYRYFDLAQRNVVAFARYEASTFLDKGFLWNDHAIGARIPVLVKFWNICRTRNICDSETDRLLLTLVARSGLLLAKPEHYAWRTGHGIVQDLALLQISAAFPFLSESDYFRDVAAERFSSHMAYYINGEGVTLLHSAGYHSSGLTFLGIALRLFTLNHIAIPIEWWERYDNALDFYANLRRPDGTLPMYGDTSSLADRLGPPQTHRLADQTAAPLAKTGLWQRRMGLSVYPEAGHAIWWQSRIENNAELDSQTAITWSFYPGLGHKLADEMSILIWAFGRNWLTNVGYWPYGHPQRPQAESWSGSNAPHLSGESASSNRSTRLVAMGSSDDSVVLEMQRTGPDGYKVERTVVALCDSIWLVMDQHHDHIDRPTSTFWTFYPDLDLKSRHQENLFVSSDQKSPFRIASSFQTSAGGLIIKRFGSDTPFAGWVVQGQTPTRASAIEISNRSNGSWQLSAFAIERSKERDGIKYFSAEVVERISSDRWVVNVSETSSCPELSIERHSDHLLVKKGADSITQVNIPLHRLPDVSAATGKILTALEDNRFKNEHRRSLFPYRLKATYFFLAIFFLQELVIIVLNRAKFFSSISAALRPLSVLFLLSIGLWLTQFYLVAT